MDENSVSFQMFLILLSPITLGSAWKAKFLCSSNAKAIFRCVGFFLFLFFSGMGEHA